MAPRILVRKRKKFPNKAGRSRLASEWLSATPGVTQTEASCREYVLSPGMNALPCSCSWIKAIHFRSSKAQKIEHSCGKNNDRRIYTSLMREETKLRAWEQGNLSIKVLEANTWTCQKVLRLYNFINSDTRLEACIRNSSWMKGI